MKLDKSVELVEPGVLTFGACWVNAPPLHIIDENGEHSGYEPAVARALCDLLGVGLRWVSVDWSKLYPTLDAGRIDGVFYNQSITPERLARADFTVPYGLFSESVLVMPESPVRVPADLRCRRVGALAHTSNEELAEAFDGADVVPYPASGNGFYAMLKDLHDGRIDALVDDELFLRPFEGYRIAFSVPTDNPYGIALRKGSDPLRHALDGALDGLVNGGKLERIWNECLPPELYVPPRRRTGQHDLQRLVAEITAR